MAGAAPLVWCAGLAGAVPHPGVFPPRQPYLAVARA
jgi:hypothetical protein